MTTTPPASPEPMPEPDNVWFCVGCNDANVTRSDAERWCLMCGVDLCSLGQLRALLATQGLRIVDDASAKVLEASSKLRISKMGLDGVPYIQTDGFATRHAEAELARREKEKP